MSKRMKFLESKLGPLRVRGAYSVLAFELRDTGDDGPANLDEVAGELGVHRNTLYEWRKDPLFIEFKNSLADDFLLEKRAIVNRKLMSLIDNKQPSVKAMDLYFRRFGLLTERQIVEQQETPTDNHSNDQIEENTKEIEALLEEGNE